jgi:L-threonylcarbamoyladenylate synthase
MERGTDKAVQDKCLEVLRRGGLILYPTDTVWGIGCDATNADAVHKVYTLKNRPDSKALICLVSDVAMLERYIAEIPSPAYDIIALADKPTTIVYDNPTGVAENLVAPDNTLAIRVARDRFCRDLIRRFRKPLVSTSANIAGKPTPATFKEIDSAILKGVDYTVPLQGHEKRSTPSAIIRLGTDGSVKVIRT